MVNFEGNRKQQKHYVYICIPIISACAKHNYSWRLSGTNLALFSKSDHEYSTHLTISTWHNYVRNVINTSSFSSQRWEDNSLEGRTTNPRQPNMFPHIKVFVLPRVKELTLHFLGERK